VTFEHQGDGGRRGASLDAYYHDVIVTDDYLALVYDHSRRDGLCYRPAPDQDRPVCLRIEGGPGRPAAVHLCYATECWLPYGDLEFLVFTLDDSRRD
jgi:hypothetical protein